MRVTKLSFNRPLAACVLLTFSINVGCTGYRGKPSPQDWRPIPLSGLPGSEDRYKGKRMRFHLANGGTNDVVVERIDSTFVYAWDQWDDGSRRSLAKTH
jgi:hypothetical protein